jgi:hypothetical protein
MSVFDFLRYEWTSGSRSFTLWSTQGENTDKKLMMLLTKGQSDNGFFMDFWYAIEYWYSMLKEKLL